jgi:hypothetical protein
VANVWAMTMAYEDVPFSELLDRPAATLTKLDTAHTLRLSRGDAEDLVLIRASKARDDAAIVDFAARLLAGLVRLENTEALRSALPEALPWTGFLPPEDAEELLNHLIDTVSATVPPENLAPIAALLARWRRNAAAYADPALYAILMHEYEGDFERTPVPEAAG